MAKLRDLKWCRENEAGDKVVFTSSVLVDGDGVFYMTVPEYIYEAVADATRGLRHSATVVFHRGKHRVTAKSYDECVKLIGLGLDEYLICEITKEPVIIYTFISTCHFHSDGKGNIYPNGYGSDGKIGEDSRWAEMHGKEGGFFANDTPYIVGFRANVVIRVLAKRQSSSKISYERPVEEELGEWANKLNTFTHTNIDPDKAHEMPYLEETAEFFYKSMINLCKLSETLANVLSTPERILEYKAIPALSAGTANE